MPRPYTPPPPPGRNDPRTFAMLDALQEIEADVLAWNAKQAAQAQQQEPA